MKQGDMMKKQNTKKPETRSLARLGFRNYCIDTNRGIRNLTTNEYHVFDSIEMVTLTAEDGYSSEVCVGWIVNMVFLSPIYNMDKNDYRSLSFMGCPGFYVTRNGHIWASSMSGWISEANLKYDGYVKVSIYSYHKKRAVYDLMHRVVAKAFIDNPENKLHVNHKDGNKENNEESNLEWAHPWENLEHARNSGTRKRVTDDIGIHKICKVLENGVGSPTAIAQQLGLPRYLVSDIKAGAHRHISKEYDFEVKTRKRKRELDNATQRRHRLNNKKQYTTKRNSRKNGIGKI